MLLKVGDPAQAVHEILSPAACLFTGVMSAGPLEMKAKADSDAIHEACARLGISSRDQIMFDSAFPLDAIWVVRLLCAQRGVIVE